MVNPAHVSKTNLDLIPCQAIKELKDKAKFFESTGMVPVMDHKVAAIKSDSAISDELKQALKDAVAPLENVPDGQKDWHPRSNGLVLDVVHPSLWPLMYGRSRVLTDRTLSLDNCLDAAGTGVIIPPPSGEDLNTVEKLYNGLLSVRFQWLPCDVDITDGKPRIKSYINNIHPTHNKELYQVIENILERTLPLWDLTYRWPTEYGEFEPRIKVSRAVRECTVPDVCGEDNYECDPYSRPKEAGEQEIDEDEYWDLDDDHPIRVKDLAWFDQTHPCEEEDPEDYVHKGPTSEEVHMSGFFADTQQIQVIVKLANIHLTPEKPTYPGGSWHIEGQVNEHICATALYYYDSDNITDSYLGFRHKCAEDDWSMELNHKQSDFATISRVLAIDPDQTLQEVGRVLTREGRLLTFPNLYQHRVSPFELADKTKPGHRKILALFLVDPEESIISTANVPPQRQDWWTGRYKPEEGKMLRLPPEVREMVMDKVEWPMSLKEAKEVRLELMDERSVMDSKADSIMENTSFNFCEH
jgi:hypothetical protein